MNKAGVLQESTTLRARAGFYGVPLVAVSGDEASVKYIQSNISPKMATAIVKKGIGQYNAICFSPQKTKKLIKNAVIDGLKRRKEILPLKYENPIIIEVTYPRAHFFSSKDIKKTLLKQFLSIEYI